MPQSVKPQPFATIILAGGKGTRMGSSDRHKVCFEVLGVPVIVRAIETYNLCGASGNVVVVGMMAESVMNTVNKRFPGIVYAYQERPLGTGDAARKGAQILERMGFSGNILVVAGDKLITPSVIRRLLFAHSKHRADVTLATAKRPPGSSTGILLKDNRGQIIGILEESERQRLTAIHSIGKALHAAGSLSHEQLRLLISTACTGRTAEKLLGEIQTNNGTSSRVLSRDQFSKLFSVNERAGILSLRRESVPVCQVLERFDQMNLSTYLFRAPVLYEALGHLKSSRPSQEEYLTDVFGFLAQRKPASRIVGFEISDTEELMAFNNPQELLSIEEVYRRRNGGRSVGVSPGAQGVSALPAKWLEYFAERSPAAVRQMRAIYGDSIPWPKLQDAVTAFQRRFGDRPVVVVRSPGRINLMGRHIDHQGGTVNVMAVDREILFVASAREDDAITLSNADGTHFTEQVFRISDLVANLNWDDWQNVVDGPRIQRLLEAARGDWGNYVKAAILRLQEKFRERPLRGMDIMVSGDIPMGAGLSSSSALVVAAAEAARVFNNLPLSARGLVSLCGEGEWFVGTRGGAADHAAIRLSRRGCVTQVGFFPFQLGGSARFPDTHDLVVCNSGIYAGKSAQARNIFNAKVTAYCIGKVWFKMLRPDLGDRIEHLRDINPSRLRLSWPAFVETFNRLPVTVSRSKVQSAFGLMPDADRERLERLFASHDAPSDGYQVRGTVLFGLSEMARASKCLDLLKGGEAAALGEHMKTSHDGDRVSRNRGRARPGTDSKLDPKQRDMSGYAGHYACSLPDLDRIVDIACGLPGVEGAQLAGAGLGGCVMMLCRKESTAEAGSALKKRGISAEVFHPIAGASTLSLD